MMETAREGRESRSHGGLGLYSEYTGRFARMLDENQDQALTEYGFTFLHSVDESDSALFLKSIGLAKDTWRQRFLETVAMHRRGRLADAEAGYKKLLSEDKNRREIEFNLSALYLQRGEVELANQHLTRFEAYLATLPENSVYVEECRAQVNELKEEIAEY